ncbi:MAG: hypothetical protein MUC62_03335 [Candidatus Thermoplasmatota archaeon]|jgi:hypothetical protein|nr:hypothetical protein [Candidatus Thermoplasmatota archaeon]
MGLIRDLIIDGIVGKAIGKFEELKDRYPLRKAKLHSALLVTLLVTLPLMFVLVTIHLCLLLWDIFEPFSVGVPLFLHLVPLVLYIGALVFSTFLVLQLWSVLALVYRPLDELMERGVSELMDPIRTYLMKLDLTVLTVFVIVFAAITAHGSFWSYTAIHFALQSVAITICAILMALSLLIYLGLRGILQLLFNRLLRRMDESYGISKRLKKFYDPLRKKASQ